VALLSAAALAAIVLTSVACTGALMPGEVSLAQHVQETPGGHTLAAISDVLVYRPGFYLVLAAGALLALHGRDRALLLAALFVLAASALNPAIKEIVQRDRPAADDLTIREHAPGFGYPSGHAMTATLIYGYAAIAAWRYAPRPAHIIAIGVALAAISIIAWDRVYNGAHWPSDVAGGAAIGLLLLAGAVALSQLATRLVWRPTTGPPAGGERRTA
jgi:undecaprenyl-diphosphatase